ncbi:putative tRNA methyl transferase [Lyophyllum shimeji]|uniref:tRNA-5-taurinomethyluridine 2-sulfurtransferase n=1 Tax=Lyophyllum shimeji TaxID=47721 RepID=A0A9P3PFL8_LYOSH|nr:putative tRNA methyl transferase [Lyophyllum shimeji]
MATCLTRRVLARYFQRRPLRRYTTDAAHLEPKRGDRVVVGMSGGVDSSVAAKLLADRDYDLSAVFMRNWDTRDESGTDKGCEWEKDWEDVQRVCKVLGIPCEMIDLSQEYWNRVFEPSLHQWEDGVTPNPDVLCNKEIKFGALLERLPIFSSTSSTTWFATGHYARKHWALLSPSSSHRISTPRARLLRAADRTKDQTYFLASISEQGLSRALFPLGDLTKPQVRELAKKFRLPTAERKESMGVCFIGEKAKFSNFISAYIPPNPGPIVDISTGETVATHEGIWTYTIGQGAKIRGMSDRTFVVKKDTTLNTIFIAHGPNHPLLYCRSFSVQDFAWIWADSPPVGLDSESGYHARLKIRHRMEPVACTVHRVNAERGELVVKFDEPEKGVAPGQVAVLYDPEGDWVLGCGTIADTRHHG